MRKIVGVAERNAVDRHVVLAIGEAAENLRFGFRPARAVGRGEAEARSELDRLRIIAGGRHDILDELLRDEGLRLRRIQIAFCGSMLRVDNPLAVDDDVFVVCSRESIRRGVRGGGGQHARRKQGKAEQRKWRIRHDVSPDKRRGKAIALPPGRRGRIGSKRPALRSRQCEGDLADRPVVPAICGPARRRRITSASA